MPLLLIFQTFAFSVEAGDDTDLLTYGIVLREQGNLDRSIEQLTALSKTADAPQFQSVVLGELGATQIQAHRYTQAESSLRLALALAKDDAKARPAFYLGNLSAIRKRYEDARFYYQKALRLSSDNSDFRLAARLNLARLAAESERPALLMALSSELFQLPQSVQAIRFHLNLGEQARRMGADGGSLAYLHLQEAQRMSRHLQEFRLQLEALDALSQLYEDRRQIVDAIELSRQGINLAKGVEAEKNADLMISLSWRLGRLLQASGYKSQALAAYQRAVYQVEQVRQDLPIEDEEGRSTFHQTLEPLLLGYADLALQQLDAQTLERQASYLRQIVNAIELVRQSEMQDFLGDRCALEAIEGNLSRKLPQESAVLYPIVLEDRVELLLETDSHIVRYTVPLSKSQLHSEAAWLVDSLRYGYNDYQQPARKLYDWLLRPIAGALTAHKIRSLVVVPDGVLRLVPWGVLHDGGEFAIEKYAVSLVTGMSMTNTSMPAQALSSLIVGMAEPGPVVEKLSQPVINQILYATTQRSATPRSISQHPTLSAVQLRSPNYLANGDALQKRSSREILHDALRLPGVKQEVESLSRLLDGKSLLDSFFTIGKFKNEATAGDYNIVHIASHGIFGGNADSSYIMAYDDLLTLDGLQSLLKSENFRKNPIELLSLSACETADGNERSPLGISGAAIKARAKSVLGTLWPVDDNAARKIMERFYLGLRTEHMSKTAALRQAQIELIRSSELAQPFFWAPFVLIGNWL
jgi:CHAT domain-containing protein